MSSLSPSASGTPALSSASATPVSSSAAALPTGCSPSLFPGPGFSGTVNSAFAGCVVGIASVLPTCCAAVGSTPVFANDTCGCPFSASFPSTALGNFLDCASDNNAQAICNEKNNNSAGNSAPKNSASSVRWNFAVILLGMGCVLGAVGL
ncbi:hypothetical protein C8R43DRAFT_270890 [Mycena crocata]|nr:hypothetical protein C8R43DRAFT_270890 [Mycena crocata]